MFIVEVTVGAGVLVGCFKLDNSKSNSGSQNTYSTRGSSDKIGSSFSVSDDFVSNHSLKQCSVVLAHSLYTDVWRLAAQA